MAVQGTRTRFIHIDVWVSVSVRFVHCLPASHDTDTVVAAEIVGETDTKEGLDVISDVFESPASIVFDQAENRPHTIKAPLVATLGQ